jgi:peptidoglycan/xylan/chitin deacetylase (PgdA/CDA1 family)
MILIIFLTLLAVIIAFPLLVGTSTLFIAGNKPAGPRNTTGLLFHAITSEHCSHFSYYSTDKFRRFIESLDPENFATCTLSEAFEATDAHRRLVITFDDGFLNFLTDAFPILEQYSVKSTIFSVAGYTGRFSEWDVLPRQPHLSKEQLREISDRGHEIGSHTMSHAKLTFLSDVDLERELSNSKKELEDIIGKPVNSLSFPFGGWNERIWEKALAAGYTYGTCFHRGKNVPEGLLPLRGVYSFDEVEDVLDKANPAPKRLISLSRSRIMPHFAKGTPLWKFRKNYALISP